MIKILFPPKTTNRLSNSLFNNIVARLLLCIIKFAVVLSVIRFYKIFGSMSSFRRLLPVLILVAGIFSTILYFSCAKDACATVHCFNAGSCNGGSCSCPMGWTDAFCQTSAFAGNWTGTDACDSTHSYNFSISVAVSSADTTKFFISNMHGFNTTVTGVRSGATTINIASQPCDTVNFSGTLTLTTNNALTFSYSITDTGGAHAVTNCNGSYTRM